MSQIGCEHCGEPFDAAQNPICPACLVATWLANDSFVRPKHDPRLLPLVWEGYRSVLSPNLVENPRPHLEFAAKNGRWYRDTFYEMFVHMTYEPMGLAPGAGIPEGKVTPEHSLDSLMIAEANSKTEAHAFAVSREQFEAQIRAGEFASLAKCSSTGCDNSSSLGATRCTEHMDQSANDAVSETNP
jgi:hypothetical protein